MSGRFLVPVQVAVRLCAKFCYRQELDEIKRACLVGIGWGGGGFLFVLRLVSVLCCVLFSMLLYVLLRVLLRVLLCCCTGRTARYLGARYLGGVWC